MPTDAHADAHPLDLVLTRIVEVPRALVWRAWTEPDLLKRWFTPAPWTTVECEIDLRPGGIFRTVMRSPEGVDHPSVGCYLEVVAQERLTWTDALSPGFRPAAKPFLTAVLTLQDVDGGTRYTARALHKDDADRRAHEEMGFHAGWSAALDQLVALMKQAPR